MSDENINELNIGDIEEPEGTGDEMPGRPRKRKRNLVITLAVIILIAAAIVIVVVMSLRGYHHVALTQVAEMTVSEEASYANLNGFIINYSRDSASCINPNGNTLWTESYEMQQPVISVNNDVAAIADRNGTLIKIFNKQGILGTVQTDMPIRAITVAENGEVAAVLDDTDVTWVYLYSQTGTEIAYFKTTMDQTGYPVSVAISPNGRMVCMSAMQIENTQTKTTVSFYDFSQQAEDTDDNFVCSFDYTDEVVTYVQYLSNSCAFGASDSRLVYFKGENPPDNSTNILFKDENLRGLYYNRDNIGLLFPDTESEEEYRLDVYDTNGTKTGEVNFTMDFTNLQIYGGRVYINNDQECRIYSIHGREIFDGSLGTTIDLLIPSASASRMTVVSGDDILSVNLS